MYYDLILNLGTGWEAEINMQMMIFQKAQTSMVLFFLFDFQTVVLLPFIHFLQEHVAQHTVYSWNFTLIKCAGNFSAFLKKIKRIILAHTAKIIAIGFLAMKICSFNGILQCI